MNNSNTIQGVKKKWFTLFLNKSKASSLIVVVFFFQYGLMIPLTILFGSQLPIVLSTIMLLVFGFLLKNFFLTKKTFFLFALPLCLLIFKLPFEYETIQSFSYNIIKDGDIGAEMIFSFLSIGISGILLGSLKFSYAHFLKLGLIVAWINFIILFFVPFTDLYNEVVNYMKFGYTLLPTVLISFVFLFINKKKSSFILFFISFADMVIFGSRGSLLTFILFALFFIYFNSKVSFKTKLVIVFLLTFISAFLKSILEFILETAESYSLYSYALIKYLNLLDGSSLASTSSGRDEIYSSAISRIYSSPFWGSPINSCFVDTGSAYYHNVFLDIIVNFGVIIFVLFLFYILSVIYRVISIKNYSLFTTFFIIFFVSFGRLLVSSSFWQRPEFWLLMGISISFESRGINKKFVS